MTGPAAGGDDVRRNRFLAEPFVVLATHGAEGRLDLVPCCFALDPVDGALVTAVDHKPKRHQRLARLANVEADPNVSLLADHRDPDDWSALWWIRVHGTGRVVTGGPEHERAVAALAAKYRQYREHPPDGPVIRITPLRWSGWSP